MILGHLAISTLIHRYLRADFAPVIAGGVFPDIVDKTLCQILHLTPSGRMYTHTLLSLGLSTAVVGSIWGRRTARSWALGYLGHLVADVGGQIPWMYPFADYEFPGGEPGLREILRRALEDPVEIGVESALTMWALCALAWPSAERQPAHAGSGTLPLAAGHDER